MPIINKYDQELIEDMRQELGLKTETAYKNYLTLKEMEYSWELLLAVPEPLIYLCDKMFKNNWKELPEILKTTRPKIFYASREDYLRLDKNNEIVTFKPGGVTNAIFSILLSIKHPNTLSPIDQDLTDWWKSRKKNPTVLLEYYNNYLKDEFNKQRVDIIFSAFETSTALFKDITRRCTELDIYKAKLLYLLYFKEYQDTSLLRNYNIYKEEDYYNVETLVTTIKEFLKFEVDKETITTRIELVPMDENILDTLHLTSPSHL